MCLSTFRLEAQKEEVEKNANEFHPFSIELINKIFTENISPKYRCATNRCSKMETEKKKTISRSHQRKRSDKWLEKRINKKPVPFLPFSILSGEHCFCYNASPSNQITHTEKNMK